MPNNRNRVSPKQAALIKRWLESLLHPEDGPARTQTEVGELLGVSQPLISDFLRGKQVPTRGTLDLMIDNGKKRLGKGHDFDSLMQASMYLVGPYEARAMIKARGQALDILSAIYDQDFLLAIETAEAPPGGEEWSVEQWVEHIVQCRRFWRAGSSPPTASATNIRRLPTAKKGG